MVRIHNGIYDLSTRMQRLSDSYETGNSKRETLTQNLIGYLGIANEEYTFPESISWEEDITRLKSLESQFAELIGVKSAKLMVEGFTRVAESALGYSENDGGCEVADKCRNYAAHLIERELKCIGRVN